MGPFQTTQLLSAQNAVTREEGAGGGGTRQDDLGDHPSYCELGAEAWFLFPAIPGSLQPC